jgi:hypothetical protein
MTHFKQSVGKVDSPISISESSEPVKPKSKLKTKTGLAEEGDFTRHHHKNPHIRSKPRYWINELHKEKSGSKDLKH